MSRDHRRLRAFQLADTLVVSVYESSSRFPAVERFGLQSQIRRSAVSVASNVVEGSARRTTAEYVQFLNIALDSAAETRYLVTVAARLGYIYATDGIQFDADYARLCSQLECLIQVLSLEP